MTEDKTEINGKNIPTENIELLPHEFKEDEKEKSLPQILAILTVCLTVVVSGEIFAWPSPFITKLTQDKEHYNISEYQASFLPVINTFTMIISPFIMPMIDKIGRKNTILLSSFPFVLSLLIKAFVRNIWLLYISRIFTGVGDALNLSSVPVYIGEISTPKVRGIWASALSCSAYIGFMFINILGTYFNIQVSSLLALLPLVIFYLRFKSLPESPYFHIMKEKEDLALESLRTLRCVDNVNKELCNIRNVIEKQSIGTWKDVIFIRHNRLAVFIGCFLRFAQHFSGFFVFSTYTEFLFEKSGCRINSHYSAIIYSGFVVVVFLFFSYNAYKLGRRKSYIFSTFLAGIVVVAEGIYFYFDQKVPGTDLSNFNWFPLAGLLLFVIVANSGLALIPGIISSEIFSISIKAKGVSLVTTSFAIGGFLASLFFSFLNNKYGLYAPFLLFGICNFVSLAVGCFILPETRGKSLEEIQIALQKK